MAELIIPRTEIASTGIAAEIVDSTWVFPGAFRNTGLTQAITVPGLFPEVTRDHILGVSALRHFLCDALHSRYLVSLILEAGRRLAHEDSSGALVAKFDQLITVLPALAALPDENRVKYLYLDNAPPRLIEEKSETGARTTAVSNRAAGEGALAIREHAASDALSPYLFPIQQAILAELEGSRGPHSDIVRQIQDRARSAIQETWLVDRSTESYHSASVVIARHAPHLRILQFMDDWQTLNHRVASVSEALRRPYEMFPMFAPRIFLHASHGLLYESRVEPLTVNQGSADDVSLDTNTFVVVMTGGLAATHARYDAQWGALRADNPVLFGRAIQEGMTVLPGQGEQWRTRDLQRLAQLFPVVDWKSMESAIAQLSGMEGQLTPHFVEYLGDRENWFGPVMRRDKKWLIGKQDKKLIDTLTKVHAALEDPENSPYQEKWLKDLARLSTIFSNSLYLNGQVEEFLLYGVIKPALTSRVRLEDLVIHGYGDMQFKEWFERGMRDSGNTGALARSFVDQPGGGVRLSEYAVYYLRNLIDPTFMHHVQGDDDRDYQEEKARRRR